jgi:hypothetical protein
MHYLIKYVLAKKQFYLNNISNCNNNNVVIFLQLYISIEQNRTHYLDVGMSSILYEVLLRPINGKCEILKAV